MKKISILILLMTAILMTFSGCFKGAKESSAIVTIKSDAIIELIIDENGKVASVAPLNASAEVATLKLDIMGDSMNTAVRKLIIELSKLGYINAVNKDVYVDTLTNTTEIAQNYNRTIFNSIKSFNKSINVLSYDFKLQERDHRSFVRNTNGFENLDLLRYRLISGLKRYRSDITYKIGAHMSADELMSQLIGEYAFVAQFHSYALSDWFIKTINAKKLEYGGEMAELLGGVFKQNYDSFYNVNAVVNKIFKTKHDEKLLLDKVGQVLNIVGISDSEQISSAYAEMSNNLLGYPTIASLESYIDNMYVNKVFANTSAREAFEKQIDMAKTYYNLNFMELTKEEKQQIIDALPITIVYQYYDTLNTLEDVHYLLSIMADLSKSNYQSQYAQATAELKAELDAIAANIDNAEKDSKSEHRLLIDKELERLSRENQRRREIYQK